ncbi:hypothetical protein AFCA_001133 [Aspergillus flavus]|uniref:DEAD/DEAH box helicase n=1 Tax=Aspergillus flavus TaxID=5059 RepID=A0AB74CGV5_ASPFL|nr:DEAD/DEAH box helicase [Aspergillus flavus]UCK58270.1 hypothetical protein AFCA_001133 [Aspergillus flavus]
MIDTQKLHKWYNGLYSRTLDLVGDYAGDELFILEGDSLLLHCFSDDQIDFTNGFQLLHATYLVEKFLAQLHQRKCNFHIAFFKKHAYGCIPPDVSRKLWPKYRLAREAILHHLLQNLPITLSSMRIGYFETYECEEFERYLVSVDPYFLMCHDGASSGAHAGRRPGLTLENLELSSSDDDSNPSDVEEPGSEIATRETGVMFRSMIHHFICRGYNISLINSLECRDTKVMAMVVEDSADRARQLYKPEAATTEDSSSSSKSALEEEMIPETAVLHENAGAQSVMQPIVTVGMVPTLTDQAVSEGLSEKLLRLISSRSNLYVTQRDIISILAVSVMFKLRYICSGNSVLAARSLLLHAIILRECKLDERTNSPPRIATGGTFMECYSNVVLGMLTSTWWQGFAANIHCDIGDMIDGRLFQQTLRALLQPSYRHSFSPTVLSQLEVFESLVKDLCEVDLGFEQRLGFNITTRASKCCTGSERPAGKTARLKDCKSNEQSNIPIAVLPFSNPVLDPHLSPVSLAIDHSAGNLVDVAISRISEELSHWHNHRKTLDTKTIHKLTGWQLRRNQFFMAEMRQYAASLTNSTGGILKPETVFVQSENNNQHRQIQTSRSGMNDGLEGLQLTKNRSTQKSSRSKIRPSSVRDQAAAQQLIKRDEAISRHWKSWRVKILELDQEHNYAARYVKLKQYLQALSNDKRSAIESEVLTYGLSTLVVLWIDKCSSNKRDRSMSVAALIWATTCEIARKKHDVTEDIAKCLQGTISKLGLPAVEISARSKRPLSFQFAAITSTKVDVNIGLSTLEFQLTQAGPYLDRSMGSAPDPRVYDFEPDKWQREILDQIDARKSLFVVAPTSAGKTFISFYAIKQILEDDNEGVIVYVAPTKALVNQIAAEVQARFSKNFKETGKSVLAIHTRDYRINNPTGCQVLITVPHILQIMLLAPANADPWSSRVKRIIFDEIHCIGQADDGVIWEQLLLLAPCPIIALSATVGNPQEFNKWLELTQRANGNDLKMIEHSTRYSDLRKYTYHPPASFVFNGFSTSSLLAPLGLDNSPNMSFMHPVASLIDRSRGIPNDLTLEPRDCWTLWNAMEKYKTAQFPVDESLNPSLALPAFICKANIIQWEAKLKALLKCWMNDDKSPFDAVLNELSYELQIKGQESFQVSSGIISQSDNKRELKRNSILDTTLPLICSLHDQGALPALFFNYDRSHCERICHHLLSQLKEEESRWKASSSAWANDILGWEEWKTEETRSRTQKRKETGRNSKVSKDEQMRETASVEPSKYSSFDPEAPISGFHLADMKKLLPSEFEEYATELRQRLIPEWLIEALRRGIGVHHAGLNRKYRHVCEILFRRGYLRVVIATGTLALGINMPCKTVVFSGDSVFLTALGYRQAAGRAGRRGFDFLGNVVFQGVTYAKVCRLLSSKLPNLNGHFPITTSLVLRLFILLHESKQSPYAVKAINSILSCPRIYLGGPESKHTVLHHLRFSIEYLRRNYLLDQGGAPLNFSNTIAHLYYTGNSSFAFHALLSGGYFHDLCRDIRHKPKQVLLALMLVMSHLFGRQNLRPAILESQQKATKSSTSVVVLPPMPKKAAQILHSHNEKTLNIYSAYVTTYINQHIKDADCFLPLTNCKCGGDTSAKDINPSMPFLPPTQVTSAFVALSGHRDRWNSIPELCKNVRSGVWLEQAVVPYVGLYPKEGKLPLNAYLLDFFKHGNVHALEKDNRVRKGDIWFVLNDFSLVLATIVTSLENFLKLSPNTDPDLLDIMGSGDAHEEELDISFAKEKVSEPENKPLKSSKNKTKGLPKQPSPSMPVKVKKPKVAESWEDEVSDDEPNPEEKEETTTDLAQETPGNLKRKTRKKNTSIHAQSTNVIDHDSFGSIVLDGQGVSLVLEAFRMLQAEFNDKFKAMWA